MVEVTLNTRETRQHPAGKRIEVKDGHLHVLAPSDEYTSDQPVAIYTPGEWLDAEVKNA